MIHVLGLDLNNVVTFKRVSLDFTPGLTYVRGLNLDSDAANPTSNGAGKSLLFSSLANVLYQSTPLSLKKKSKKDILRQKGSSVGLILKPHHDAPEYEILQTSGGYKIYEDGTDQEVRTIPIAEEYIRKLFPLTETKFYSTCYLSTQRPYLLQRDTDSNRLQHLSDIFNLDQYSSIKEALAIRARSIKDHEIKLGVLEQHRLEAVKKLEAVQRPSSEAEYETSKRLYDKLSKRLERLQNELFGKQARKRDLDSLVEIEQRLDSLRKEYPFKQPPNTMLSLLRTEKSSVVAWDRWSERTSEVQKSADSLDAKLKSLGTPASERDELVQSIKSLRSEISDLDAAARDLKKARAQHQQRTSEISEIDAALSEYDSLDIPNDVDFDAEIAVCKSTLKLESLISEAGDDSTCPTCQSELNLDELAAVVRSAKKRLVKYARYRTISQLLSKKASLASDETFDARKLKVCLSKLAKATTQLEEAEAELDKHKRFEHLTAQRQEIVFPKRPKSAKPEYSLEQLDSYIHLCSEISEALSSKALVLRDHEELSELRSLASVNKALAEVSDGITVLDKALLDVRSKIAGAAASVSSYEHYLNTHAVYASEIKDLDAKIATLRPALGDKKLLDILLKAYGTKGLRSTAVNTVCQLLQSNLNHYRDLIFAEPFSFEIHASETGVSMLVDRNNGKQDSVSDVRNLSGAESNSFSLLCLMALLPLLPDSERVNFVLLDEPTSHMCPISRAIFNERYLPVLREMVPTVFVISPHSDDSCPNSKQWTIKKQSGISSLTEH